MSLLDIHEVQDICRHTALRARKWSGFICKRASKYTTLSRYRSTEEREECQITTSYFARCVRKLTLYSDLIHLFDWISAVEHDGGV